MNLESTTVCGFWLKLVEQIESAGATIAENEGMCG